jgi:hypothetical protein
VRASSPASLSGVLVSAAAGWPMATKGGGRESAGQVRLTAAPDCLAAFG